MLSTSALTLIAAALLAGTAAVLIGIELERRQARRVLRMALIRPQTVEKAWVSPPDETGLRCLFVKAVGEPRASTVAMDFEVDEVVRRFSQAGIPIGYEDEDAEVGLRA